MGDAVRPQPDVVRTGIDGATGDPDDDGVTNAQELAAGTHPRGFYTRYLAEGATNAFFDAARAAQHGEPGRLGAAALPPARARRRSTLVRAPAATPAADRRRRTTIPGLNTDFSTVVESRSRSSSIAR